MGWLDFIKRAASAQQAGEALKERLNLGAVPAYRTAFTALTPAWRDLLKPPSANPTGNALIHAFGAANLTLIYGPEGTYQGLRAHELAETTIGVTVGSLPNFLQGLTAGGANARAAAFGASAVSNSLADFWNNFVGMQIAVFTQENNLTLAEMDDLLSVALENGLLAVVPNYGPGTIGEGLAGPVIVLPFAGQSFDITTQAGTEALKAWMKANAGIVAAEIQDLYLGGTSIGALGRLDDSLNPDPPYGASQALQDELTEQAGSSSGDDFLRYLSNPDQLPWPYRIPKSMQASGHSWVSWSLWPADQPLPASLADNAIANIIHGRAANITPSVVYSGGQFFSLEQGRFYSIAGTNIEVMYFVDGAGMTQVGRVRDQNDTIVSTVAYSDLGGVGFRRAYGDITDPNAPHGVDLRRPANDTVFIGEGAFALDAGFVAGTLVSSIVRGLVEDPLAGAVGGVLLGALAENVAEGLVLATSEGYSVDSGLREAFRDLPSNLGSLAVGSISSLLVADLFDSLGIEGAIGDFAQNLATQYVSGVIQALPQIAQGDLSALSGNFSAVQIAQMAGSFLGAKLASELVEFNTIGGQIGASAGAAIGGFYVGGVFASAAAAGSTATGVIASFARSLGTAFAGPVGAFIGAFVGYILGGLIGSLFGGTPKSGASIGWNGREYAVGHVWAKNGGAKDAARSFASNVAQLLNGVIATSGSVVIDASGVQTGAYETKGSRFIYRTSAGAGYAYATKDASKLVTHGQFIALSDLSSRLMGGDVYVKRALMATLAQSGGDPNSDGAYSAGSFDVSTLLGNISTAQEYRDFIERQGVVTALIAAAPESAVAAGWVVTLARVIELGLDKRWASDWIGGWNAFLDETANGSIDGVAFSPGNVVLVLDPSMNERLFGFFDEEGNIVGILGDTIDAASKDIVRGSAGADTIVVSNNTLAWSPNLTLEGVTTQPTSVHTIRVAALLDGGAGDDVIRGGDLGNDLLGGEGADTLIGGKLDDWVFGGAGDDRLYAGSVADPNASASVLVGVDGGNGDYLDGGDGNDALYGGRGSDWLSGGAGVDTLYGGGGGDIVDGGAGNDRGASGEARLLGGAGSDQYVFYFGGGADVIFDESDSVSGVGGADSFAARMARFAAGTEAKNWAGGGQYFVNGDVIGGEDAIAFGPGVSLQNLIMRRAGEDLVIELQVEVNSVVTLTGDALTIKDWFHIGRRVEWLRFADGEDIRIGDITSFIAGTSGPDVIIGSFGADFIVGGEGNDVIRGLAGDDFGFGGAGDDFVAGDSDNDMVAGGSGNDEAIGGGGNDTVFGDAGNDDLYGGAGSDILAGGLGDDTIVTGAGDDIVRYHRGDGRDVVLDEFVSNWDVVWQNGAYLNGYTLNANGTVTLGALVVFDGAKWIGQYDWDDVNKVLRRHKGAVSGQSASNAGNDKLEFAIGIDIQDLSLRRVGNDVEIAVGSGEGDARGFDQISDRVLVRDWYLAAAAKGIENFVFTEIGSLAMSGYTLSGGTDNSDTLAGTIGADWITGGLGDDILTANNGADIVVGGQGFDVLKGQAGDDIMYGGAGDDVLEGGAGVDQLFGGAGLDIATYAASTVGITASLTARTAANGDGAGDVYNSIEGLEGSGLADRLTGDGGDNILRGLAGADTLIGGAGDDTYEIDRTHGADTIRDGRFVTEQVLDAAGNFNATDFTATWTLLSTTVNGSTTTRNYRLVVTKNGASEEVYRSRDNVDFVYVNQVQATAPIGTAWPFANGQWLGGFARTGNDVQTTRDLIIAGEGGNDTIQFGVDISLSDLAITRTNGGADLSIAYNGTNSVAIEGQNNAERRIEAVTFADGLVADLTALKLVGEAATANGDLMFGDANANTIDGLAGNDVLSGMAGNDTLRGNAGDDVLEGGAGSDTLDGGTDSQTDGAALSANLDGWGDTIRYVRSTAAVSIDLAARTASGGHAAGDVIALGVSGAASIEHVVGSNTYGDTLRGDARANRLLGLGGNDILEGRAGDDVLIGAAGDDTLAAGDGADSASGDAGNDTITGGLGKDLLAGGDGVDTINGNEDDDSIVGGAGADILRGDAGNDTIGGEADNDQIYGDVGADKLAGGDGNDTLYGGADNDTLAGEAGNDALRGELGDDVYVFDAASGADTIVDADGANRIVIAGLSSSSLWLSRVGDDLKISAIGVAEATFSILVTGYYAATTPSRVREIATADASIFLAYAEPLIAAMSAAGTAAPAAMPSTIASTLATYWHAGGKAAPRVTDANVTTNEDVALSGAVGAIDHDENISGYALEAAPGRGAVTVNEVTGAWVYTPAVNYHGADAFSIRVTDADGQSAVKQIALVVTSVNDAPNAITLAGAPPSILERDRPQTGAILNAIVLGTLSAADVDAPDAGDFDDIVFSVTDARFEIVGTELRLKAGAALDFEVGASVDVAVTATDRAGAGLALTKTFTFVVADADDYLYGTAAGETLSGQAGRNIILGYGGADMITGGANADTLDGGDGADVIQGLAGADQVLGGLGNDNIDAGLGDDNIDAGDGDDVVSGGDGVDQLLGGVGNDALDGGLGADTLMGGDNADALMGGAGDDRLEGGTGDDVLEGGAGADRFLGGAGADTITYTNASSGVIVNLATLSGSAGDAAGDVFEDVVEKLVGSNFGDTITGSAGVDVLDGGAGDDVILGGLGADTLIGGEGNDTLDAQAGNDTLNGGAGADVLIGGDDSDTYLVNLNSGADLVRNFHQNTADVDVLGYQGIDRKRLWFAKSGDNLVLSVIGTDVTTTIENWYIDPNVGDRLYFKLAFIVDETGVTTPVNAEGLVAFLAGYTRPTTQAAYDALHASGAFEAQWQSYWSPNALPTIADVGEQTISEGGLLSITVNITDDITPASGLTLQALAVRADNEAITDTTIVDTATFGEADANGDRTLTVTTKARQSGPVKIKLLAQDAGGRIAEKVFLLNVTPVANAPLVDVAQAVAPIIPLTQPTLDSGSWALDIQAALVDPSETLEVRISNVPAGLSFNQGTPPDAQNPGVWRFTRAQLVGLRLQGPTTWATDLVGADALTIIAISTESDGSTATTTRELRLAGNQPFVINARPTDIAAPFSFSVNEGTPEAPLTAGAILGTFTRQDEDNDGFTFSFASVNNVVQDAGGRFTIDGAGQLRIGNPTLFDFESANVHTITLTVADAGGLTRTEAFAIAVGNVNERPVDIWPDRTLVFNEGYQPGQDLALFGATDPENNVSVSGFALLDNAGGRFQLSTNYGPARNVLQVGTRELNYEEGANPQIRVEVTDANGLKRDEWFTIVVQDVNETPVIGAQSFALSEAAPGAGLTLVGTVAWSDPDTQNNNRDPRFSITDVNGNALSTPFSINDTTGQIYLQGALDYESMGPNKFYDFYVQVRDQAGAGLTNRAPMRVNVTNEDEAPSLTLVSTATGTGGLVGRVGGIDPEGGVVYYVAQSATAYFKSRVNVGDRPPVWQVSNNVQAVTVDGFVNTFTGNVYFATKTLTPTPSYALIDTASIYYLVSVRSQDLAGNQSSTMTLRIQSNAVLVAPIVLDLDGDGLELVNLSDSTVQFDMAGNGEAEHTGWVGADDGLLVYDRSGNGSIDNSLEIAFSEDVDFAVSDLEGLRSYDSNQDGQFGVGDAEFSNFAVWRDTNQDGVSQAGELSSLAALGIDAISLTLTPTGESAAGATDNVVYGTSVFVRSDGTVGTVGDVYLAYTDWSVSIETDVGDSAGLLPPVVLDLDGDGVKLTTAAESGIRFDANGDEIRERTGWFSAGDGVLALDRNGDGAITSGLEISFLDDVDGAQSDLEGLAAFDSNENGTIDVGDVGYGGFLVWRDANQDGISQRHELASLARHGIASINLTRSNAVQAGSDTSTNRILATTNFVWRDGRIGQVADVVLAYGENAPDDESGDSDRRADAIADVERRRQRQRSNRPNGPEWINDNAIDPDGDQRVREWLDRHSVWGGRSGRRALVEAEGGEEDSSPLLPRRHFALESTKAAGQLAEQIQRHAAPASALHRRLGAADARVLHMVNSMAVFGARDAADLARTAKKRDPRVAEMLTALPDLR